MNLTQEQRIRALEAGAYRTEDRFVEVDGQLKLVRGAIDELSADLRAHRQETKERFDGIDQRFDGIEGVLRQILAVVTPQAGAEVARQGVGTSAS